MYFAFFFNFWNVNTSGSHYLLIFRKKKKTLGGNQRDLARAKNQKKMQDMNKGKRDDGLTPEQRKLRYRMYYHTSCINNSFKFRHKHRKNHQ